MYSKAMKKGKHILQLAVLLVLAGIMSSCGRDNNDPGLQFSPEMYESIPYEPFKQVMDSTTPFKNGQTLQEPPAGTISRDGYAAFEFAAGDSVKADNPALKALKNPVVLSEKTLKEGEVLYARFCLVCHGKAGAGNGKVAQHDAINPSAFNSAKLAAYTPGQIYHTLMYGQGVMGSYASQLEYEERWKVIHFVNTLQGGGAAASDSTASSSSDSTGSGATPQ
jgi:mono/diheme cytochrome c family protein